MDTITLEPAHWVFQQTYIGSTCCHQVAASAGRPLVLKRLSGYFSANYVMFLFGNGKHSLNCGTICYGNIDMIPPHTYRIFASDIYFGFLLNDVVSYSTGLR